MVNATAVPPSEIKHLCLTTRAVPASVGQSRRRGSGGGMSMGFRILSLDGGGSWSLLQIMTLIDLYRSGGALLTGHEVLRDFDLVIASGSGSLVLGGLV